VNVFIQSAQFAAWMRKLRDRKAKARILSRLDSAALGNFGDCAPVGEAVFEMRIHLGPGYRIYFTQRGSELYLLLAGGDKGTQKPDIRLALEIAQYL
jgi:putative addiction module killer protein